MHFHPPTHTYTQKNPSTQCRKSREIQTGRNQDT